MESVVFDGKEFVKASVLAEKFRYTQDYLGQLCRGKKVDARLVGRAWYINLDSLNSHRTARYKAVSKPDAEPIRKASNHYLSRIDVEPILKQKTVKIMKGESGKLTEFSMKYEGDDYSLIPRVNKSAISSHLHIIPAEAEKLKVHKDKDIKNVTNFKAEPLPEVYLSGTLKVEGIDEVTEETQPEMPIVEEEILETAVNKPEIPLKTVKIRLLRRPLPQAAPVLQKQGAASLIRPVLKQQTLLQRPVSLGAVKAAHAPHTFTPAALKVPAPVPLESTSSLLLPVASVLLGLLCGFFILTAEVLVETIGNSQTNNFVIKAENVRHAAEVIFSKIR